MREAGERTNITSATMTSMETKTAPVLSEYMITGMAEYATMIPGVGLRAAGSCDHCGTGIRYGILVARIDGKPGYTKVGTSCAERIGLDREALREYNASKYAAERDARNAKTESGQVALHGEHGTATRSLVCYCDACDAAAPHGSMRKFHLGCLCDLCVESALEDPRYESHDVTVLTDLEGNLVVTQPRSGRYGMFWAVDGKCVTAFPKREATIAKKGYREVDVPCVVRIKRDRSWWRQAVQFNGEWINVTS